MEYTTAKAQPFLRWAGGKRWLLDHLVDVIPSSYNNYHEPFLGGGSVFFSLPHSQSANLSDLNEQLINTYIAVRDNVEKVIEHSYRFSNTKDDYYIIRRTKFKGKFERAAQFLYLNQTSFNGIYRVNSEGVYNVPYGYRQSFTSINEDNLRAVSNRLENVILETQDFGKSLSRVKKGDLVYLDPPYTVAHENNGFIEYNQKIFSLNDQIRIAKWLNVINQRGAFYILSNAKHASLKEIYKNAGQFIELKRKSLVGGKCAARTMITEYLITNIKQ